MPTSHPSNRANKIAENLQNTARNFTAAEVSPETANSRHLTATVAKNKRRKESIQKLSKELIAERRKQFKREFDQR